MFRDIRSEKNALRAKCSRIRDEIPKEDREKASLKISERIRSLVSYRNAETVLLYYPIKSEVDTLPLASFAFEDGKKVAFPICKEDREMHFGVVDSLDGMVKGKFSIPEPNSDSPIFDTECGTSICIIPALAYDKKGFRVGYGGGYYDNFLRDYKGSKIGVAFYASIVDSVPHGKYDNAVDVIITERKVFTADAR